MNIKFFKINMTQGINCNAAAKNAQNFEVIKFIFKYINNIYSHLL